MHLDHFKSEKNSNFLAADVKFDNEKSEWVSLISQIRNTHEFLAPSKLKDRFDGTHTMKTKWGLDRPLSALNRSINIKTKLKSKLPKKTLKICHCLAFHLWFRLRNYTLKHGRHQTLTI